MIAAQWRSGIGNEKCGGNESAALTEVDGKGCSDHDQYHPQQNELPFLSRHDDDGGGGDGAAGALDCPQGISLIRERLNFRSMVKPDE